MKNNNLLDNVTTKLAIAKQLDVMGSFAGAIGKAILLADSHNLEIINNGFADLISQAYEIIESK